MIKYGGHAMDDPALADLFAQDVVLMRLVGMNPVVVHGGGPQISDLMRRLGKEPEFVDGLRVTDAETVDIARMALVGKVNREIVASLNQHGSLRGRALGRGRRPHPGRASATSGSASSATIRHIDPSILERLLREELIPVIATIGMGDDGPGLQRQRRHRRRRDRRGARRREARVPHRRRRRVRRLPRRELADLAHRRRRARAARRRRARSARG